MPAAAQGRAEAQALHQAGRLREAARLYEQALQQAPGDAALLGLLGALRVQLDEVAAGAKLLRRAVAAAPGELGTRFNLGVALLKLGQGAEAVAAFAAVTTADPGHLAAWKALGDAWILAGAPEAAAEAYRQVLARQPDHPGALGQLGGLLNERGAPAEALPLLRRALALRPGEPGLHNNLGLALHALGDPAAAEAAFRRALALRPGFGLAAQNLAQLLAERGHPAEAEPLWATALAAAGSRPSAELLAGLLEARAALCRWEGQDRLLARVLAAGGMAPNPFVLSWHGVPPARVRPVAKAHARAVAAAAPKRPAAWPRPPASKRLRIGYLSADFREHATAYLLAEVLELHDRDAFEPRGYALSADDGGPMRRRLEAALGPLPDCTALSAAALAERIAADGIDLLVDLHGWTRGHRQEALVARPAPVQASWLGYPGTTGAPWIDYAIVDPVVAPPGAEAWFTEALVRLPVTYQPNDRRRAAGPTPSRAAAGLPADGVVLACFCQPQKIAPPVFAAWMRILAALPGAVLWLLQPGEAAAGNLRRAAAALGIDPARLAFAPLRPLPEHLARYGLVDLALDSFPYGSHTTASDALWAGCPLLGLTGGGFPSRVSTSILRAAGLGDLAFADLAGLEAAAIGLGRDPAARAALRARVAAARTAPLFDAPRFTRALEAAFAAMVGRQRAGLPPAAIDIPA